MEAPAAPSIDGEGPLRAALAETGAIGSTVRQLARRLELDPPSVLDRLDRLAASGEVVRLGRGLWVLRDFEELVGHEDFVAPAEYRERFERESGIALGRYVGPITFRPNDRLPIHRWWPYVQGYSAEFVRSTIETRELAPRATVLDPFAGSGTTLVEARRLGARAVGYELLPPAALAARVKCRFELDPAALGEAAEALIERARLVRRSSLPFLKETRRQFDPPSLLGLLRLRDALSPGDAPVEEAVRLAFGAIVVPSSRLRRSPCLGYGPPRAAGGPTPTDRFRAAVAMMQEDLRGLPPRSPGPPALVVARDARGLDLPAGSVDLAVTSPPYVNGLDYVMNYKLDLAWLGYARSYAELARLRSAEVACDNLARGETTAYLGTEGAPDPWLPELLGRIRERSEAKGSYRRDDMHAVVHRYFRDLTEVLGTVYRALAPGARFVLVIGDSLLAGTYVPGDLLLARIGASLGYRIVSVDVARSRRSGQRRSFVLRESIVTLERPR